MSLILPQSADIKPPLWGIDPGIVAYNAARMGLPMPVGLWTMWGGSGGLIGNQSGNTSPLILDSLNNGFWTIGEGGFCISQPAGANNMAYGSGADDVFIMAGKNYVTLFVRFLATTSGGQTLIDKLNECSIFFDRGGNQDINFATYGANIYLGGPSLSLNELHTVVVLWKQGSWVSGWVDGMQYLNKSAYADTSTAQTGENFYVGSQETNNPLQGKIDSIIKWDNVEITHLQVQTLNADPYGLVRQPDYMDLFAAQVVVEGNPWWYYNMIGRQ